jgi:hypothetical protein
MTTNKKDKPDGYVFGRPTAYRPEFCQTVIDIMKEGGSRKSAAVACGVTHETLIEWEKKYLDFSEALRVGLSLSEEWWETHGRKNLHNKDFNTKLWDINMQNRFKWSRREQTDAIVTIKSHEDMLKELK